MCMLHCAPRVDLNLLPQFSGIPLAHFLFFSGMTRGIGWPDPVRMRTRNAETAYTIIIIIIIIIIIRLISIYVVICSNN